MNLLRKILNEKEINLLVVNNINIYNFIKKEHTSFEYVEYKIYIINV